MTAAGESQDVQPLPTGTVLDGRYRLDSVLGAGAMGCVYLGEHVGIGRSVAIKVLRAGLGGRQDAARRFKREALASGRLDHPNIVDVSDSGVLEDGSPFLVMEALHGESLGDRLKRERRIPWPEAVELMRGVLRGLDHAHQRGVVHRDIKPDNIFLAAQDGRPRVKLLDFGIAKLIAGTGDDPTSTHAGLMMGTPAYVSPEQAVGGEITAASDLYSATVVLFEMLTGGAVFAEPDLVATMMAHVGRPPPTLAEAAPDLALPPRLEDVVRRGLEKRIADRIGSAAEYLELLDGVEPLDRPSAGHAVPGAEPAVPRPASIADAAEPIPRTWLLRAGAVLGAVTVLAIVAVIADGGGARAPRGASAKHAPSAPPLPTLLPAPAPPEPSAEERGVRLKALLYDLNNGKTCAGRRAAISELVELDDPEAIPALRAARYRMRGGLMGIGASNTNECLRKDAEAAIKALGRPR